MWIRSAMDMWILVTLINSFFFFFNDTATTEIYTLSLHDALPICHDIDDASPRGIGWRLGVTHAGRSEEHTSELQSRLHLVCRLLLEKKNKHNHAAHTSYADKRRVLTLQRMNFD